MTIALKEVVVGGPWISMSILIGLRMCIDRPDRKWELVRSDLLYTIEGEENEILGTLW